MTILWSGCFPRGGGKSEREIYNVKKDEMLKNIVFAITATLFVLRLLTNKWPHATTEVLHVVSLILVSVIFGISLAKMFQKKSGGQEN